MIPTIDNTVVLIPARAGSKGVPKKNSKPFAGGLSLVERTLNIAKQVFPAKSIILSTDDEDLLQRFKNDSISLIHRDPHLASDKAGMLEVMLDAINKQDIKPNYLVLLQPTSPFRTVEHLKKGLNLVEDGDQALVSVNKPKGHPFYTLFQQEGAFITKFQKNEIVRRQDLPDFFDVNGLLYIFEVASLENESWVNFSKIRPMEIKSWEAIDIDTEEDWMLAEKLFMAMSLV